MALSADNRKIYDKERYIGRKAAKMARDYVLNELRDELTIRNQGGEGFAPILKATKVTAKMGSYRLLGINFTSSKAGFIQHYGFMGVRDATTVLLSASRYNKSATRRKASKVNLKPKNFFQEIYVKSGALDYLANALGDTRMQGIELLIAGMVVKLNQEDNGK